MTKGIFIEQQGANECIKKKWVGVGSCEGKSHTFIKEGKNYHITVPHPEKDLATGTLRQIPKTI
jgi:hypothetical protein